MGTTVTRQVRAERRGRAEERQAAYDALPPEERLERLNERAGQGGKRERNRILRKMEKEAQKKAK